MVVVLQVLPLLPSTETIISYLYRVIGSVIVLVVSFLIGRYLGVLLERSLVRLEEDVRERIIDVGKYLIYAIGILISISILSPEPITFSILILLVGLGVIISISDLLRNWGSEFYVRIVRPFKIGDWIEIRGREGRVIKIDSFGIVIESVSRERVYIPNTLIAREMIINRTTPHGTIFRFTIELPSDVDEVSVLNYINDVINRIRPELADEPKISYKGVYENKSVFELSIVLLNVRKIDYIYEYIARSVSDKWSLARVRM
ncbi:MAG: mechanosensitive ion channel family protein [Sulfolobales archaeon]